jgi:hypothetical protein
VILVVLGLPEALAPLRVAGLFRFKQAGLLRRKTKKPFPPKAGGLRDRDRIQTYNLLIRRYGKTYSTCV